MPSRLKILLIGGSGFVSGTLARLAVAQGHAVWAMTRGQRALPVGVTPLVADRKQMAAFASAIEQASVAWDLVVDCIGYGPEDAQQDVEVFRERASHLVFISTDFVYAPDRRRFPRAKTTPTIWTTATAARNARPNWCWPRLIRGKCVGQSCAPATSTGRGLCSAVCPNTGGIHN